MGYLSNIRPINYGGGEWQTALSGVVNNLGGAFAGKLEETKLREKQKEAQLQSMIYELDEADLSYKEFQTKKLNQIEDMKNKFIEAHSSKEGLFEDRISDLEMIQLTSAIKQTSGKLNDLATAQETLDNAKKEYLKNKESYDPEHFASWVGDVLETGYVTYDPFVTKAGDPFQIANQIDPLGKEEKLKRTTYKKDGYYDVETYQGLTEPEAKQVYLNTFENNEKYKRGLIQNWMLANEENEQLKPFIDSWKQSGRKDNIPQEIEDLAFKWGMDNDYWKTFNHGYEKKKYNPQYERLAQAERRLNKKDKDPKITYGLQQNVTGVGNKQGDAVVFNTPDKSGIEVPSNLFDTYIPKELSGTEIVKFKPNFIFKDGEVQGELQVPTHEKEITEQEYNEMDRDEKDKNVRVIDSKSEPSEPVYYVDGKKLDAEGVKKLNINNRSKKRILGQGGQNKTVKASTDGFKVRPDDIEVETVSSDKKYYKTVPKQTVTVNTSIDKVLPVFKQKLGNDFEQFLQGNSFNTSQSSQKTIEGTQEQLEQAAINRGYSIDEYKKALESQGYKIIIK